MPFLKAEDRPFIRAVSKLGFCNPFLPERVEYEKDALGEDFTPGGLVWTPNPDGTREHVNLKKITRRTRELADKLRSALEAGAKPGGKDLALYEDLVLFLLYNRYQNAFLEFVTRSLEKGVDQIAHVTDRPVVDR